MYHTPSYEVVFSGLLTKVGGSHFFENIAKNSFWSVVVVVHRRIFSGTRGLGRRDQCETIHNGNFWFVNFPPIRSKLLELVQSLLVGKFFGLLYWNVELEFVGETLILIEYVCCRVLGKNLNYVSERVRGFAIGIAKPSFYEHLQRVILQQLIVQPVIEKSFTFYRKKDSGDGRFDQVD